MSRKRLIGPFAQLLTMDGLPSRGPIKDDQLEILHGVGILVNNGRIESIAPFARLENEALRDRAIIDFVRTPSVCLPGFIDCHTHICWAGSRARDYALRISGTSYQEIAARGGGILETVTKTRRASLQQLTDSLAQRCDRHLKEGVTTCEVKSGYCLNVEGELKMLRAIQRVNDMHPISLVATCLAAHVPPKDFDGTPRQYLEHMVKELISVTWQENLSWRADIFVEENAFSVDDARWYLQQVQQAGFSVAVHGDQFSSGGADLAIDLNAVSVDHLEHCNEKTIQRLAQSRTVGVVLPGASLGLGEPFAPARKLLDAGATVAIASDWNPGSAPMGDLLLQAALLSAAEKLTTAETFAGLTTRAAAALRLKKQGVLTPGYRPDFISFPVADYREILYHQGKIKPNAVWKNGRRIEEHVQTRQHR